VEFESVTSFLGQRSAIIGIHELPFDPLNKKYVKPHVRADLKGVYTNLQMSKGLYVSKPEPFPVTKYIDQEGGYAS
jgi:hypothetical protein